MRHRHIRYLSAELYFISLTVSNGRATNVTTTKISESLELRSRFKVKLKVHLDESYNRL